MRSLVYATSERRDGPMGIADGASRARVMNPVRTSGSRFADRGLTLASALSFDYHRKRQRRSNGVKNRRAFLKRIGAPARLFRVTQVHGKRIVGVTTQNTRELDADGMITTESGISLGILTADCVPIFFWDRNFRAIGIVHAGWRGVQKGVAAAMVRAFAKRRIPPSSLRVFLGPAIQKCHFEIWPAAGHKGFRPFLEKNRARFLRSRILVERTGRTWFDLPGAIRAELVRAGVAANHIRSSGLCTFHLPKRFFSHRRATHRRARERAGSMLSVISFRTR